MNKEYNKSKISAVLTFIITLITSYFHIPIIEKYAWVILFLCVLILTILFYKGGNRNFAIFILILGSIVVLYLSYNNTQNQPMEIASGTINIDLERVYRVTDFENPDNKEYALTCEYAKLTNLETGFIYQDFEISDRLIIFKNVRAGQYNAEIKIKGMKPYAEQIEYTIGTLSPEKGTKLNKSKIYRFVKYTNATWSEWSEWSEWQNDRVENDSVTDVEIKREKEPKKQEVSKITVTYKDKDKPIYGYKEVTIPIGYDGNSNVIWTTQKVKIIIDYGTSTKVESAYYFTEDKNNIKYRYRKRNLISGETEHLYAVENNLQMLKDQGYEIERLVH